MPTATNIPRVFALVLAAGAATRFGAVKQLAPYQGEALARRAVQAAGAVCGDRTVVVLGHEWRAVYESCKPVPGAFVINTEYATGIGTSIAAGAAAIRHVADAILVVLADQPLVTARHLEDLQATWSGGPADIVASSYAGTTGVPALFPRACFDQLCKLDGDTGAQKLLHDPGFSVHSIEFADAALDVDTPSDLLRSVNSARS